MRARNTVPAALIFLVAVIASGAVEAARLHAGRDLGKSHPGRPRPDVEEPGHR